MILPQLLAEDDIRERKDRLEIWELVDDHHLRGVFHFSNFQEALDFTMKVGVIAENMQHHPEINLSWGRVEIIIFTHDRGGLTELDFIYAEKVLKVFKKNDQPK